jgi:hypothetical protein
MNEKQWRTSADPGMLLAHVNRQATPHSLRKLRLFACACCRRWWPFLTQEWARRAVEVSEQFADDLVDEAARAAAEKAAGDVNKVVTAQSHLPEDERQAVTFPDWWVNDACRRMHWASIWAVMVPARATSVVSCETEAFGALEAGAVAPGDASFRPPRDTARLVREVFGNPFRPVAIDPRWLAWGGGTVPRVTRAIYEGRRFQDLPVLADALEEAGCAEREVLDHCREADGHVAGCWLVDALLGRG